MRRVPAPRRSFLSVSLLLALLLAAGHAPAAAQAVKGALLGTVTDGSGAAIAGAQVTATEVNTNIGHSAVTNDTGNYVFASLDDGTYTIAVEKPGFKKAVQANVLLAANQSIRTDLRLAPGTVTETVEVTATPLGLQTDRVDTGRTIPEQAVRDLPTGASGNVQSLAVLLPGMTNSPHNPHSQFFNSQQALAFTINGQSRLSNSEQIDGLNNDERTGLLQIVTPNRDAVQEVSITTGNFEAEFGRAGGSITNVILKSGGNNFHGTAYEYLQNSALNAGPYNVWDGTGTFAPGLKSPSKYNQFGGSFGGPIRHNKTFFFVDYQTEINHSGSSATYTVPNDAFRHGDFSALLTPAGGTTYTNCAAFKTAGFCPDLVYDPSTGGSDPNNRQPFAGNIVPLAVQQANPAYATVQKLLSFIPEPNVPGRLFGNYRTTVNTQAVTNSFDVKLNHQPNANETYDARFTYERPKVTSPGVFGLYGGPSNGGFNGIGLDNTYQGSVDYTRAFSPSLLSEFRFGVSRYRNDARNTDYGKATAASIGIPGANLDTFSSGLTTINLGSFSNPILGYSNSLPWVRAETAFEAVNNWTKIVSNHTIKWGGDFRRLRDELLQLQDNGSVRGSFDFNAGTTANPKDKVSLGGIANSVAALLLNAPTGARRDEPTGQFPALRQSLFFAFLQDKWQVTPSLTIDLGLRNESYEALKPRLPGGLSNYEPTQNVLRIAGIGGIPMSDGIQAHLVNLGPRTGLAWRINDKTVFRGGYGISTIPFGDNSYAFNYPLKQNIGYPVLAPFTSPHASTDPNSAIVNLSNGFPALQISPIPSNGILPVTGTLLNTSFQAVPDNLAQQYLQSWNVALQRALPLGFTLEAAYVANHGIRILYRENLNLLGAGVNPNITGQTTSGILPPKYPAFKAEQLYLLTGFSGGANSWIPESSSYNSLQVKLDRRFHNGLGVTSSYTWGKAIDYGGNDNGGLATFINPRLDRARGDNDRRQTFSQSFNWVPPLGNGHRWANSGLANLILGGWQANGIWLLYTGTPLNFGYSNGSDTVNSPGNANHLDQVGAWQVLGGHGGGGDPWFAPGAFAAPPQSNPAISPAAPYGTPAARFGNLGRNTFSGPGFFNLDASVFRNFRVTERVGGQFRLEGYSATNTPHFGGLNLNVNSKNFGDIGGAGGQRSLQLALRLNF